MSMVNTNKFVREATVVPSVLTYTEGLTDTSKSCVLENPVLTDIKSRDIGEQVKSLVPRERICSIGVATGYFYLQLVDTAEVGTR